MLSCGNELDLTNYADPTPIVYGIISPNDSIHQISLKRSFLCENNIPLYASNPDSNYYSNAQVFLETRVPTGEVIQRSEMFRYELPTRETDMFVNSPNYVYQCVKKDLLKPMRDNNELRYVLTIDIPDHKKTIYAESIIPPPPDMIAPKAGDNPFKIDMLTNRPFKFIWRGSLYYYSEFEIRINYLEERMGEWVETSVSHHRKYNHWDKQVLKSNEVIVNGDWFYPMLGGKIKDDPEVTSRKFKSIDFIIKNSDEIFYDYFAYEHFLTDLTTNNYSNIVNGLGIFIAYNNIEWLGYTLNYRSLDHLAVGKYTKHLNFSRWD